MVRSHLLVYGIIQGYTFWYHHGESFGEPESHSKFVANNNIENDDDEDETHELLLDLHPDITEGNMNTNSNDFIWEEPNPEAK